MRRTARAVLLALLAAAVTATAADDKGLEIRLAGDLYPEGEPRTQGWLRETGRYSTHLSAHVIFAATLILERDSHGDIDAGSVYDAWDRGLRRSVLRFGSLLFRADLGRVTIEAGRQRLAWGRTDGINPTDNLTPRDWTDPLDEIRLSPWALRATVEAGRWNAEAIAVPVYAPSRLPVLGGRWFRLEPSSIDNPAYPGAGPPRLAVVTEWGDADYPTKSLRNVQSGLRGGYRGSRGEWSLSWYDGFDHSPRIEPRPGAPDIASGVLPVRLDRRFPRLEVAGGDGVLLAGPWAFRAEAGYFHFPEGRDDGFLMAEVEAEWTAGAWRAIAGYGDAFGANPSTETPAAFDRSILPAAFFHVSRGVPTEWEISVHGFVGTAEPNRLIELSGSLPVREGIRIGAEIAVVRVRFGATDPVTGRESSLDWSDGDRLRLFALFSF